MSDDHREIDACNSIIAQGGNCADVWCPACPLKDVDCGQVDNEESVGMAKARLDEIKTEQALTTPKTAIQ